MLSGFEWELINLLRYHGSLHFNEICRKFPWKSKTTVKNHLDKLRRMGLIYSYKVKNRKYYELYGNYMKIVELYSALANLSDLAKLLKILMRNIHKINVRGIDYGKLSKAYDDILRVLRISVRG